MSSEFFSYSDADIRCTSDSLYELPLSSLAGLLLLPLVDTDLAASLDDDFFAVMFLSALYKSIALAAECASSSFSYRAFCIHVGCSSAHV